MPGFVEIDLVGHEGGNAIGDHAYTLTVTDIATGWTENRSVQNKAQKVGVRSTSRDQGGVSIPDPRCRFCCSWYPHSFRLLCRYLRERRTVRVIDFPGCSVNC